MTTTRFIAILLAAAFCFVAYASEREIAANTPAQTLPAPVAVADAPAQVGTNPGCQQAVQRSYPSPQVATVAVVRCIGAEVQVQTIGTAVRVGETRWVSAMHVVNENDKLYSINEHGYPQPTAFTPTGLHTYLIDSAGQAHEVTRWRAHTDYDIVAFDAPGASGDIRPLRQPGAGEAVTAYGPYAGKIAQLSASAMTPDPLGRWSRPLLELNGLVERGYSGGPILDAAGNLVGVSYAITGDRTYAVPVEGIAAMVTAAV